MSCDPNKTESGVVGRGVQDVGDFSREPLRRSEHTETYVKEKAEWTRPGPADPVIQGRDQETARAKWLKPSQELREAQSARVYSDLLLWKKICILTGTSRGSHVYFLLCFVVLFVCFCLSMCMWYVCLWACVCSGACVEA